MGGECREGRRMRLVWMVGGKGKVGVALSSGDVICA